MAITGNPVRGQVVRVLPQLSVRGGLAALDFYRAAFGAEVDYQVGGTADNQSVVAQLSIEGAPFWVADESPEHANFSPESLAGGTVRMILTVPDPDVMFDKVVAAGARVVVPVKEDYG